MGGECDKAGITWLIIVYLVVTFLFVFFTMYTAVDITAAIVDIQCIAFGTRGFTRGYKLAIYKT